MGGDGRGRGGGKHSGIFGYSSFVRLPATKELLQVPLQNLLLLKGQCKQSQGQGAHLSSREAITAQPDPRHHHRKALGAEGLGDAETGALPQLPSPMVEAQAVAHSARRTCARDSQPSCNPALLCPRAAPWAEFIKERQRPWAPSIGLCPLRSGGNAWEVTLGYKYMETRMEQI